MLQSIVQYFRSCYQADFRAINLLDFFSSKLDHRLVLESAELVNGSLHRFPVPTPWGKKLWTNLTIYSKEKSLYCCAFFLVGKATIAGKSQRVCAPLYLYAAKLIREKSVYYLSIDADHPIINPGFFNALPTPDSSIYEQLLSSLPVGHLNFDQLHQIETLLESSLPEIDLSEIGEWPKVWSASEIEQSIKAHQEGFYLLPAVGAGLIMKAAGSRGILNELQAIANEDAFSPPLKELFGSEVANRKDQLSTIPSVPVTLSHGQLKTFESMAHHNLSLVVGPPGTGKSFTIAAIAVEFLSQGKSVLIASKNMQAVSVIADKIEREFQLPEIVVRAAKEDYKTLLQKRIYNLIKGIGVRRVNEEKLKAQATLIARLNKEIQAIHQLLLKQEQLEMKRGYFLDAYSNGWIERLRHWWLERELDKERPIWQILLNLEQKQQKRKKVLKEWITQRFHAGVADVLKKSRKTFQSLHAALQARTGNRKEAFFDEVDFSIILKAFPIWVTNTADINRVLPLYQELFDLVIIDEATQCDIASSIPALYRARKAVIVGDPKQLRHLSFLSGRQQDQLIQKHQLQNYDSRKLDYRNVSILDLCSDVIPSHQQLSFLDEHFRSMPDIIEFSNRQFYDNQLKIMTSCPVSKRKRHIFLHQVAGKMYKSGYNKIEAAEVFDRLQNIIAREADMEDRLCQSIGVLSPFRSQVNHLRRQAEEKLSLESIKRHRLLIGTPYDFQGEERDLMFLSFAVDQQSHTGSFNYINKADVFNVSITRARVEQHLLVSFDPSQLPPGKLLTEYLQFVQRSRSVQSVSSFQPIADQFFEEVKAFLEALKLGRVFSAYAIAGIEIDMVLIKPYESCCIDLIGYPGAFEDALPVERHQMLHRIGIRVFSLPYSHWCLRREAAQSALRAFIGHK